MKQRAMAITIAAIMVAAGLSVVTPATALTPDCDQNFEIADSEALATSRSVDPDNTRVGHEDVDIGSPQNLTVELETSDDELTWEVFYTNSTGGCAEYTAGGCNGENVIDQKGTQSCELEAPSSGTRDYFVVYKNTEDNPSPMEDLEFKTWASVI